MKKNILLLLAIFGLSVGSIFAQVPEAINYQGVARDAAGSPLTNQAIGLQINIRSGSTSGPVLYQETHAVTTNNLGLFTLMIGQGSPVGSFSNIDWASDDHFVEVQMDPTGGSSYTTVGTSQLVTVPYAFHANTVENDAVNDADADSTNELNTGLGLTGTTLSITDAGGSLTQDLSSLQDGVNDADADPTNEFNTAAALTGTSLGITDGGGTISVDLSSLAGGDSDWTISGSDMATGTSLTGNLGIKTPAPLAEIHLTQNNATTAGAGGMRFQWTTTYWKVFHSGIHFSFVDDGTRVSYVEGNTGNYVQPSDGNLKKNITPITNVKGRLLQLRPVAYHYKQMKDTDQKTMGFIAQEVEQVFPEVVRESEDGFKALSYSDFAILSVKAIQEQQVEIDAANARIAELEREMEELKQMIRDNR